MILKRKKWNYKQLNRTIHSENAKICYICKEKFGDKYAKDKKI